MVKLNGYVTDDFLKIQQLKNIDNCMGEMETSFQPGSAAIQDQTGFVRGAKS